MNYFCYLIDERSIFFIIQPVRISIVGFIRLYLTLSIPTECLLTVKRIVPLTFLKMTMNVRKVFK